MSFGAGASLAWKLPLADSRFGPLSAVGCIARPLEARVVTRIGVRATNTPTRQSCFVQVAGRCVRRTLRKVRFRPARVHAAALKRRLMKLRRTYNPTHSATWFFTPGTNKGLNRGTE